MKRLGTITLILALVLAALPASHAAPADVVFTYTVKDTSDSGTDSLRWAINQANADGGTSIIEFDIPEIDPGYSGGVWTIQPATPLPFLSSGNTTIDGYSQDGAYEAEGVDSPATIVIEIDGSGVTDPTNQNGFSITSSGNTIKGLAINRFGWSGIAIFPFGGSSATNNTIAGNFIGTDTDGWVDYGNGRDGVSILLGAQNNTIGGDAYADWNVISGNGWDGVGIHGENTTGNVVSRNYIGADVGGWDELGNSQHGVHIYGGAHHNTIGGDETERNIISGNDLDGIHIAGEDTRNNVVSRNYIGVAINGWYDVGNGRHGVYIYGGAHHNIVGGDGYHEWNIIACNDADGVHIVDGAHDNTIGSGDGSYDRSNVISGNADAGVVISGTQTMSNTVSGNVIGLITAGWDVWGNQIGVEITGGAQNNIVGGDTEPERNIISGNQESGVLISGADTSGNVVLGNYIGKGPDAVAGDFGNMYDGVYIVDGAHDNTVGPGNAISDNDLNGVRILDAGTMGNTVFGNGIYGNTRSGVYISYYAQYNVVSGNYIGIGELGFPQGNGGSGVVLDFCQNNTIGGDTVDERNIISANGEYGIQIGDAQDNTIAGNYIGAHPSGMPSASYGNFLDGIAFSPYSTGNVIGGDTIDEGNLIYGNGGHGISFYDAAGATGNHITHNSIEYNGGEGIKVPGGWTPSAPTIVATTLGSVCITGTACAGCTIEVFQSHLDSGEGLTFVGETVANSSGAFTVTVDSLSPGAPYLTATATDGAHNTSGFSDVFESTISSVFLPLVLRD